VNRRVRNAVMAELRKACVAEPKINQGGDCYYCGKPIDGGPVAIYRSQTNGTISLFHDSDKEPCWPRTAAMGAPPLSRITVR